MRSFQDIRQDFPREHIVFHVYNKLSITQELHYNQS